MKREREERWSPPNNKIKEIGPTSFHYLLSLSFFYWPHEISIHSIDLFNLWPNSERKRERRGKRIENEVGIK